MQRQLKAQVVEIMKYRPVVVSPVAIVALFLLLMAPVALALESPSIKSITPSWGPPGTSVTLRGSNFGTSGEVWVRYYQSPTTLRTFVTHTDSYQNTMVVFRMPTDAVKNTRADIWIGGGYYDSNVVHFQFKDSNTPVLESVSPNPCPAGGKLTIKGSNFGDVRAIDEYLKFENTDPGGPSFNIEAFPSWGNYRVVTTPLPSYKGTFKIIYCKGMTVPSPYGEVGAGDITVTINNDPVPPQDVVIATSRTWAHDSIGAPSAATKWYLPEGSTANGDETWVLVQNPGGEDAQVKLTYVTETATKDVIGSVPANSRKTYNAADAFPDNPGISVIVGSNVPVVAEKAVYGNNRNWGHDSIGASMLSNLWYLAEGCTAEGFTTRVSVMNPNTTSAKVTLTYMTGAGPVAGPSETLPANSRKSYDVGTAVPSQWSVSTQVTSDQPVVAERAMFGNRGTWAHDSIGARALFKTWYLAEGCTGPSFETWVLVQNPNDEPANVSLTYMTPSGATPGPTAIIAPQSRQTFDVSTTVPGAWQVSTKVTSDQPVVAERAMYGNNRVWATDSIGIANPGTKRYLAEGCTLPGFETWVLVQNPNDEPAGVTLTYMTPSGAVRGPSETLPANSRKTYNVADTVNGCTEVSTMVVSNSGVTAERAMYGDPK